MNNIANKITLCSEEEISIHDVWKKLVQYKKVFWIIFFVTFTLGAICTLLTPEKYNFSYVIEVGKYVNDNENKVGVMSLNDAVVKIKKVLFPRAVRAYNLQAKSKIYIDNKKLIVEAGGGGGGGGGGGAAAGNNDCSVLILSIDGPITNLDGYKFIFQQIISGLANETKYIDSMIKYLNDSKLNLEHHLTKINNEKVLKDKVGLRRLTNKNNPNIGLTDNINRLQMMIEASYNTRAISDFTVSNKPIGPSKLALLFLTAIASLFFAFFGVFVVKETNFGKHP